MDSAYKYTDEQLVVMTVNGDNDAFEQLVNRYEMKLLRYVKYLVPGTDAAEDITQNSFIKAYKNLKGFNYKYSFSSWIYRITHNEAINYIKKDRKIVIFPDLDIFSLPQQASPESEYEKKETSVIVVKCMRELDLKYKEILSLYYLEDKSYQDIEDILQIPSGTVAVRIRRAKEKLKEICIKYEMR